jgi:NADPH-dependent ferric siderophore reductase
VSVGRPAGTTFPVRVSRLETVVPRVVRVTFTGESLRDFPEPSPGGHLRIFFGEVEPEGDGARYARRTFTPRWFDRDAAELVVELVLHGEGLATNWVAQAEVGDPAVISGPGGRYRPAPVDGTFVLAVDDTAVPAAGTVIEHLPGGTELIVVCEVTDEADERPLSDVRAPDVVWLHRADTDAAPGQLLEERVQLLPADLRAGWFIAAEARTVRRLHRHVLEDRSVDPEVVEARGYWRQREPG